MSWSRSLLGPFRVRKLVRVDLERGIWIKLVSRGLRRSRARSSSPLLKELRPLGQGRSPGRNCRVITSLDDKVEVLWKEVQRLKDGGDPDVVAMAKRRASKAQSLADHFKIELEEATRWRESLEKELGKILESLSNSQSLV
ncbi:hypothetical protein GW17_00043955 [Ensete ventricosum]|nr:hypothetical protein GW17_00043955 [Ensete ventricosum]